MEDGHLNDLERISKLIAVIAVAFVWVYRVGIDKHMNVRKIKKKKHGNRAFIFFKYGLIRIAHAILNTFD